MKTPASESVAGAVRQGVLDARVGTFLRKTDFAGSDRAVESALSRLTASGELVRVRRGLYWRGKPTRFGMTRPPLLETAMVVAGPGSGPCGVAAAYMLGLTTQVPGTIEVTAPGKAPEALPGVRFRSRPYSRREHDLRPLEVAVLELLRDPDPVDAGPTALARRVHVLVAQRKVRAELLDSEIAEEPHRKARERWIAMAVGA